ncbi:MAG: hypothetical protein DI616_15855 [Paracoccus denitrificans]|uniref:Uncharacterized protein n=1 Tax=Paracoccus denitrificans TaxID=266 RepID=A0A533I3G5_PARDE|nr:MAG: hypothetical protein DI616_15855 [Paracoccus denitrificans]
MDEIDSVTAWERVIKGLTFGKPKRQTEFEPFMASTRHVYYVKDGQFCGDRLLQRTVREFEEAQAYKPDCVMWAWNGTQWLWWYHEGVNIHHWRVPHPDVMAVPPVLEMMRLTGAL